MICNAEDRIHSCTQTIYMAPVYDSYSQTLSAQHRRKRIDPVVRNCSLTWWTVLDTNEISVFRGNE